MIKYSNISKKMRKRKWEPLKIMLIAIIQFYRYVISGLLGHSCRFEPSCSNYGLEAIKIHGSLPGFYLLLRRLLRCHPWHAGGMDPVPDAVRWVSRLRKS